MAPKPDVATSIKGTKPTSSLQAKLKQKNKKIAGKAKRKGKTLLSSKQIKALSTAVLIKPRVRNGVSKQKSTVTKPEKYSQNVFVWPDEPIISPHVLSIPKITAIPLATQATNTERKMFISVHDKLTMTDPKHTVYVRGETPHNSGPVVRSASPEY